jgi:hypothetical protein
MAQKIHYRDDLFVLSTLAHALEAGLSVEADPEFFRERIAGDLFFLDASIRAFHDLLMQNSHLIDRVDYIKLLCDLSRGFIAVIEKLLRGESPNAEAYESYGAQLRGIIEAQKGIAAGLGAILTAESGAEMEADLVSEDELAELLRG